VIIGAAPAGWKRGPVAVYLEKIGEAEPDEPTILMDMGIALEGVVAKHYGKSQPTRIVSDADGRLFRSKTEPYLLASPDRWVEDPDKGLGVLELKTATWGRDRWQGEAPPEHVLVQVHQQMFVLGVAWSVVAVLVDGEIRAWDVPRNDAFLEAYLPHARAFWQSVQRREPPVATGACVEALKRLYPTVEPVTIDLPAEAGAWHRDLEEGKALEARGKELQNDAKAQILGAMGAAQYGRVPGTDVAYRRQIVRRPGHVVKDTEYTELRATRPNGKRRSG
jgi:predicted phage-related endonuclease